MKNYRAQTPQNLALLKFCKNSGKQAHPWTVTPQTENLKKSISYALQDYSNLQMLNEPNPGSALLDQISFIFMQLTTNKNPLRVSALLWVILDSPLFVRIPQVSSININVVRYRSDFECIWQIFPHRDTTPLPQVGFNVRYWLHCLFVFLGLKSF